MSLILRSSRHLAAILGVTVLAVATPAWASTHAAHHPATSTLRLTSLRWAQSSVDATTGNAKVALSWTITDSASTAKKIAGAITLDVPGKTSGTYASAVFQVKFSLPGKPPVSSSGTAQNSSYVYTFHVPQYAQVSPAAWQVTGLTVQDDVGNQLTLTGSGLAGFKAVLTATELVDTTPPSYQSLSLYENQTVIRPYLYVGRSQPGYMAYQFNVQDDLSGFSRGSIQVIGPGGKTLTSSFAFQPATVTCGLFSGGSATDVTCGVLVRYPQGSPAGIWAVNAITLTDVAGNTATFTGLNAVPITVTSDAVFRAGSFTVTPNPVNNWGNQSVPVQLSMTVTGATNGISAVYVDTSGGALQTSTTPVVSGSTVTVPLSVEPGIQLVQITGIAVVDGAGHVAVYAQEYPGSTDPYLLIRQLRDNVPPTATAASISPASIPSSQTGQTNVILSINVTAPIAPVNGLNIYVYDSAGNLVDNSTGGTTESGGIVTGDVPLPFFLAPGTYTIGFTITDAGYLSTSYGPGQNPMPGGPLTLTVTSG